MVPGIPSLPLHPSLKPTKLCTQHGGLSLGPFLVPHFFSFFHSYPFLSLSSLYIRILEPLDNKQHTLWILVGRNPIPVCTGPHLRYSPGIAFAVSFLSTSCYLFYCYFVLRLSKVSPGLCFCIVLFCFCTFSVFFFMYRILLRFGDGLF